MKKIEGFISDKIIKDKYVIVETYIGKVGFAYSTYMDSEPKIYLRNMPSFEDVYEYFMSHRSCLLKINKRHDICFSLLFYPYFDKLYEKIKNDISNIPRNRLRFLAKYLLNTLADPIHYKIATQEDMEECYRVYYIENDVYNKSKELLKLIGS